jgi:hypothetical protein
MRHNRSHAFVFFGPSLLLLARCKGDFVHKTKVDASLSSKLSFHKFTPDEIQQIQEGFSEGSMCGPNSVVAYCLSASIERKCGRNGA